MGRLEDLFAEMDSYCWDSVPDYDYPNKDSYRRCIPRVWKKILDDSGVILEGMVLDVCCGPVSIGALHPDTVGYDLEPIYIKELRKNGIPGVIGDFRALPFDDNSFDLVVCFGPSSSPYQEGTMKIERRLDVADLVRTVTSELIRVSRGFVLISTNPDFTMNKVPEEFKDRILAQDSSHILYRA